MFLGVQAVVAKSIERIHLANLINFGIVPFFFEKASDYNRVNAGDRLVIEGLRAVVAGDGRAKLRVGEGGVEIAVRTELSERQKAMVQVGGLLNQVASGGAQATAEVGKT